jgi:uncharacterized protein
VNKPLRPIRIALLVVFLSGSIVLGILILLAWGYAFSLTHIGCLGTHDSLASREFASDPVEFRTTAGYSLRGWFTRGSRLPETVIIVLPGMSGDTQMDLADGEILAKAGYSTFMYEHRSCANSSLLHSGGYFEADDLISAVGYLASRGDIHHIGVIGFSTGGTAALLAAAKTPRIEAVIAKGAPARFLGATNAKPGAANELEGWYTRLVLKFFSLQTGLPSGVKEPVDVIGSISPRPVLLIYGDHEASQGQTLYAQAGSPTEFWIVSGAGHGGYQVANPQEYTSRVVGFFDSVFDNKP